MFDNAKTKYASDQVIISALSGDEDSSRETALVAARAADDRKADNILVLRVSEVSYLADYFVIVTGFSQAQLRAISQAISDQVELELQRPPLRIEGQNDGNWVLMDYGDVIVHILLPEERDFYKLEAFWGHAERVRWQS
ncbi:ribosome silencing factor [Planktothrix pseudagardhii]|uniref:Ribosomal silencing factor RsfS n=1 Tax=Planktothrix pseudagardhii TaxID=132604 RepID=A0A9W4G786_9CYAN|nr:ribosome silencing factor [Planktothrix pseudagardhii]CAD5961391.1 Ribosomal silencing factor RsfS [Planktothrix pseudagardhii]